MQASHFVVADVSSLVGAHPTRETRCMRIRQAHWICGSVTLLAASCADANSKDRDANFDAAFGMQTAQPNATLDGAVASGPDAASTQDESAVELTFSRPTDEEGITLT